MAVVSIEEYSKALQSLKFALEVSAKPAPEEEFKIFRDACIQRFEFSVELAWKCSAKLMGSKSTAPKIVIREMSQNGFIADPQLWFHFIDARNQTSHTYDEDVARQIFEVVKIFLPEGLKLLEILRAR